MGYDSVALELDPPIALKVIVLASGIETETEDVFRIRSGCSRTA